MIESFRERAILAGTSLGLFLATIYGSPRLIQAENQAKFTPNQDNSHSLYAPNLEQLGIKVPDLNELGLNIPKVDSLLSSNEVSAQTDSCPNPEGSAYSAKVCVIDHLGRSFFIGARQAFGEFPNNPNAPIGTGDIWINRVYANTFQLNGQYYGTEGIAVIDSFAWNPARNKLYVGVGMDSFGRYYVRGGEVINDINDAGNYSKRAQITSEVIGNIETDGNFSPLTFIDNPLPKVIQKDLRNALNSSQRGFYRRLLDELGLPTGSWFKVLDATATPTIVIPTRTPTIAVATVTPSPTPMELVQASGFVMNTVPEIRWRDGSMETDYLVLRIGAKGINLAPNGILRADSVNYRDPMPSPEEPCYLIVARMREAIISNSDLYCYIRGIRTPIQPEGFSIGLDGDTASIRFLRQSLFDSYILVSFGSFGVIQRLIPQGVDNVTDNTQGIPKGYILAATQGANLFLTEGIFVVPRLAR